MSRLRLARDATVYEGGIDLDPNGVQDAHIRVVGRSGHVTLTINGQNGSGSFVVQLAMEPEEASELAGAFALAADAGRVWRRQTTAEGEA